MLIRPYTKEELEKLIQESESMIEFAHENRLIDLEFKYIANRSAYIHELYKLKGRA